MKILFLRHGLTKGNLEKRYVGRTDEPLCQKGISELEKLELQACEVLVSSPMKRCIQTSGIVFQNQELFVENDFRECDFGDFEGKNYNELSGDEYYQKWIDSGGKLPFPNGEGPTEFRIRCVNAFDRLVKEFEYSSSIAFIVHGGTIMSILEKYAFPRRDYYDWHCENGHGFVCLWDGSKLEITENI